MNQKLKPITFWRSVLIFGGMSILHALVDHLLVPLALEMGIPAFIPHYGGYMLLFILALAFSFMLYAKEKKQNLPQIIFFRERFMLPRFNIKDLLWGLGLVVFWIVTIMMIKGMLSPVLEAPSYLVSALGSVYGIVLSGSVWLIPFYFVFILLNVLGEELFWRGYLLPRQMEQHGKKAWIVNGVLWALFHVPIFWMMPALAPGCIALAFITQKRKSLWPALIAHFILNGMDVYQTYLSKIF
jgi:membrane protease YdiL (CAAX protease family)